MIKWKKISPLYQEMLFGHQKTGVVTHKGTEDIGLKTLPWPKGRGLFLTEDLRVKR